MENYKNNPLYLSVMARQKERKKIMDLIIQEENKFFDNRDLDKSFLLSELATKIDPNDSRPWHNKGAVLFRRGKYIDAIYEFNMSLHTKRTSTTLYMKSLCLFELNLFKDAHDSLKEAIDIEKQSKEPDKILLGTMGTMITRLHEKMMSKEKSDSKLHRPNNLANPFVTGAEIEWAKKQGVDPSTQKFYLDDGESWIKIEKKKRKWR